MSEEENTPDHVSATGFRTTQLSFDFEDGKKKRRRRSKEADIDGGPRPNRVALDAEDDVVTECPGCGIEIDEGEFVETLLSFVTGSKDYLGGDPVRVRSVQRLQQIMPGGKMPEPSSDWGVEVVSRIEQHIEKMAEERVRMMVARERTALAGEIRHQFEVEIRDQFIAAFRGLAPLPLGLEENDLLPALEPTPTFEQFSPVVNQEPSDDIQVLRRVGQSSNSGENLGTAASTNATNLRSHPQSSPESNPNPPESNPHSSAESPPMSQALSPPGSSRQGESPVSPIEQVGQALPVSLGPPTGAEAEIDEDGVAWWQDASKQWWYQPPTATDWFAWT